MLQNSKHKPVRQKQTVPAKARDRDRNPDPAGETLRREKSGPEQDRAPLTFLNEANLRAEDVLTLPKGTLRTKSRIKNLEVIIPETIRAHADDGLPQFFMGKGFVFE